LTVGGVSALAIAESLLPQYALAQTISFTDPRIKAVYVSYASPGGTSGEMRGYLVKPEGDGPFPAALVIHENRGSNPYIEDVVRCAPDTAGVPNIRAPLLLQFAEDDKGVNATWPDYEASLKANRVSYEKHIYSGTRHGFHNNSTPRYDEAAAKLAWDRTIAFFKEHLS